MKHAPSVLGILFCILLLVFSTPAVYAAREGLTLWWTVVFPALFPFFVCTALLQKSGMLYSAVGGGTRKARSHQKTRYAVPVLLLSAVSGYPGAAKLCALLYEDHAISFSEAERLTVTCNLCSPMFLLGALCTGM
ncbi:MAG: hypothetical protein PHO41_02625, partial [Eubacteriales bacterium]|nr:hypothetical protein [Eubacteriales bacterium]